MSAEESVNKVAALAKQIENAMNAVSGYDMSRDDISSMKCNIALEQLYVDIKKIELKAKSIVKMASDCATKQ
jgi:hypothetical protein